MGDRCNGYKNRLHKTEQIHLSTESRGRRKSHQNKLRNEMVKSERIKKIVLAKIELELLT